MEDNLHDPNVSRMALFLLSFVDRRRSPFQRCSRAEPDQEIGGSSTGTLPIMQGGERLSAASGA
ncbi:MULTISPECIES: hypothetical protein [Paenibacillus]|uniref:Uncharacterized protein n=1 Tax=Paenibacillus campinasensis TaxID=66347 RepID=A0A268F1Y9_9BACL|nr:MULTISPECIES: hypothetical protein [Paenibacillus]PAD79395.1 hypothetical protein CHH67_04090 [Paenibacillus campinasensis]PAK51662.1 hypothetical protein CHH75_13910 [Paenibacillus sp. 7541]